MTVCVFYNTLQITQHVIQLILKVLKYMYFNCCRLWWTVGCSRKYCRRRKCGQHWCRASLWTTAHSISEAATCSTIDQHLRLLELQPVPIDWNCSSKVFVSEQLLSSAGQVYAEQRSNLLGENAEKLLFLAYNIPVFQFNYRQEIDVSVSLYTLRVWI